MKLEPARHLDDLLDRYPALAACRADIESSYTILDTCCRNHGKILVCGNGGSAADSEHIVGELVKGYLLPRPLPADRRERLAALYGDEGARLAAHLQGGIPAFSLVSQTAIISAVSNDTGSEFAFAQQVYAYGGEQDVLLALSTSGNSPNILAALRTARLRKTRTVGLAGGNGGAMRSLCDVCMRVPASGSFKVQELHLPVYHTLCAMLESSLFGD